MKLFSKGNGALKRAGQLRGVAVVVFSIPAFRSSDGFVVCPLAGKCAEDGACYAMRGSYSWPTVKAAQEWRLSLARSEDFEALAYEELKALRKQADREGLKLYVRVHDSGDFFNREYLKAWVSLAYSMPDLTFYSYTKSLSWVRELREAGAIPENFVVTFSQGGKLDSTIDPETEKHSRLFATVGDLEAAGYLNGTKDDLIAADADAIKVGLVYHGPKAGAEAWGLPWAGMKAYKEAKA